MLDADGALSGVWRHGVVQLLDDYLRERPASRGSRVRRCDVRGSSSDETGDQRVDAAFAELARTPGAAGRLAGPGRSAGRPRVAVVVSQAGRLHHVRCRGAGVNRPLDRSDIHSVPVELAAELERQGGRVPRGGRGDDDRLRQQGPPVSPMECSHRPLPSEALAAWWRRGADSPRAGSTRRSRASRWSLTRTPSGSRTSFSASPRSTKGLRSSKPRTRPTDPPEGGVSPRGGRGLNS